MQATESENVLILIRSLEAGVLILVLILNLIFSLSLDLVLDCSLSLNLVSTLKKIVVLVLRVVVVVIHLRVLLIYIVLVPVRVAVASAPTIVGMGQILMLLLFFVVGLVILVVYDPLGFAVVRTIWFWYWIVRIEVVHLLVFARLVVHRWNWVVSSLGLRIPRSWRVFAYGSASTLAFSDIFPGCVLGTHKVAMSSPGCIRVFQPSDANVFDC